MSTPTIRVPVLGVGEGPCAAFVAYRVVVGPALCGLLATGALTG